MLIVGNEKLNAFKIAGDNRNVLQEIGCNIAAIWPIWMYE